MSDDNQILTRSDREKRLLKLIRTNPKIYEAIFEFIDICGERRHEFLTGDDAEEATVEAMQKTAHSILEAWLIDRCQEEEAKVASNKDNRPHEKKDPMVYVFREN